MVEAPSQSPALSQAEARPSFDGVALGVLDNLLEGCQVIGFDWRYLYLNQVAAQQGGRPREALLGRTMMECYPGIEHTAMFAALGRCMDQRSPHRMENEFQFPDSRKGWFELRLIPVPTGTCVLSLDVTRERRAREELARSEEQLRASQKMDALGRLTGGIAHDFNNLLSVILSYSAFTLQGLGPENPMRADIQEVHSAGLRAAALIQQLLAFSRQQVLEPVVLDLNALLRELERMLARVLGGELSLRLKLGAGPAQVKADRGQLEQVVLNLVVNARDAMPGGGVLTIETTEADFDAAYAREHPGAVPGRQVVLSVSDTGVGMNPATRARIFEPFFTTKEPGKGTGLGLATVFGIVKQSQGSIWVYSEPGRGSTFKVCLPSCTGVGQAPPRVVLQPARGGSETILLVEDSDPLRKLARTILLRLGYTVLSAAEAGEARLLSSAHPGPIQLLLTDVVLPRVGGRQLAAQLTGERPEMKVLYMSGFTDDAIQHHGVLDRGVALLQKPLMPESLARKVRQVLDE